jgi:hypothetical protein
MDFITNEKASQINEIFKKYDGKSTTNQTCEICFETKNLIICDFCKNYFHLACVNLKQIPIKYYCDICNDTFGKNIHKSSEIGTIFDSKSSLGKNNSNTNEIRQKNFKKEINFHLIGKKSKRDLSSNLNFSNSFSFKDTEGIRERDRERERERDRDRDRDRDREKFKNELSNSNNFYLEKEKVIIFIIKFKY